MLLFESVAIVFNHNTEKPDNAHTVKNVIDIAVRNITRNPRPFFFILRIDLKLLKAVI